MTAGVDIEEGFLRFIRADVWCGEVNYHPQEILHRVFLRKPLSQLNGYLRDIWIESAAGQ